MSFPTFPTREDAERHLIGLGYTPRGNGSFSHMSLVLTIAEAVGGFTIQTAHPVLQELHERSQANLEEGIHRRRFSVLGGEGK